MRFFILVILAYFISGFTFQRLDYRQAMFKNVCKDFKHDVLIYLIFVDNKTTAPWTEFDIQSTIDSVNVAMRWLQEQARKNNIPLRVKSDYYLGHEYTTISKNLPQGSVIKTVTQSNLRDGFKDLNSWADFIAKKAGASFTSPEKDGIPEVKNPKNKERLIAYLRDTYQVESVALLFMVNNYFKTDISIQVNTFTTSDVEFAVVSYKYPSEIAHNVLHLYGAADLYKTPLRRNEKKIKQLEDLFPNDIMQEPYAKNIWKLDINDYTQYLIGWKDSYDPKYEPLFTDKSLNF